MGWATSDTWLWLDRSYPSDRSPAFGRRRNPRKFPSVIGLCYIPDIVMSRHSHGAKFYSRKFENSGNARKRCSGTFGKKKVYMRNKSSAKTFFSNFFLQFKRYGHYLLSGANRRHLLEFLVEEKRPIFVVTKWRSRGGRIWVSHTLETA